MISNEEVSSSSDVKQKENTTNKNSFLSEEPIAKPEEKKVQIQEPAKTGEEERKKSVEEAEVLSKFPSEKTLPSAQIVKDDKKQIEKKSPEEIKQIIKIQKLKQEQGIMATARRYFKLGICVMILFLFASVFANIYQFFAGDCTALTEEIEELERLNQELRERINGISNSIADLNEQVEIYEALNGELTSSVSLLGENVQNLSEVVETLFLLIEAFEPFSEDGEVSYTDYLQGINGKLEEMTEQTEVLADTLTNFSDSVSALEEKVENQRLNLESEKEEYRDEFENFMNALLLSRTFDVIVDNLLENMLEQDELFAESQVLGFLTRVRDVFYLRDSSFFPSISSFEPPENFGDNSETRAYLYQLALESSAIEGNTLWLEKSFR
eukprot:augustus_masked-scaffold_32-processed-gene-2.45-mRNA-1 protein AED:1.00 eAED:1.00 QI:0/-1/0/0/-1/1/1/0/382